MPRPHLSVELILAWADDHKARTGAWPHSGSGAVQAAPHESWAILATGLREGYRGLPAGLSLARLLADRRGKPPPRQPTPLTPDIILGWADAHHARTGFWPGAASGPVAVAPGESWGALNLALRNGFRGLPGGDSLAELLERQRGRVRGGGQG